MQSRETRPSTMLHPLFIAGVLEGLEGTLDEIVGRVESPRMNAQLDALRSQVTVVRICIEELLRQPEGERVPSGR